MLFSTAFCDRRDWRRRSFRSDWLMLGTLCEGRLWHIYAGEVHKKPDFIREIINPALRADLSMMQTELIKKLNAAVGSMIITEIRFY